MLNGKLLRKLFMMAVLPTVSVLACVADGYSQQNALPEPSPSPENSLQRILRTYPAVFYDAPPPVDPNEQELRIKKSKRYEKQDNV
jgi:hypothetical protein